MAYGRSRSLGARLLAIVALCALAATYLMPLVNSDWNAWRHDHGHASLGAVGMHSHPWDDAVPGLAAMDASGEASEGEAAVVFTGSDDSTPGTTAIWHTMPVEAPVILNLIRIEEPVSTAPAHEMSPTAPPPPRAALAHI